MPYTFRRSITTYTHWGGTVARISPVRTAVILLLLLLGEQTKHETNK